MKKEQVNLILNYLRDEFDKREDYYCRKADRAELQKERKTQIHYLDGKSDAYKLASVIVENLRVKLVNSIEKKGEV